MSFYSKQILPHLIDWGLRNREAARLRQAWIPRARGDVLEIGIGSGLNLPFYSSEVRSICGVDPSVELQRIARKRAAGMAMKIEFLTQFAEEPLPIAPASIDTVVVTWVLCSIPNPREALLQMKRVLKPGGHLIFIEHGRAPNPGVARWQDRVTPLWKHVAGGCHLNRKIDDIIMAAGFRLSQLETCYLPGPRIMTYNYQGIAEL